MSVSTPCLRSALRNYASRTSGSCPALRRSKTGKRRYSLAQIQPEAHPESSSVSESSRSVHRSRRTLLVTEDETDSVSRGLSEVDTVPSSSTQDSPGIEDSSASGFGAYSARHLDGLFHPLKFPPELARRILTHSSHPAAIHGHNSGLRFIGRRVIEAYLLIFLHSSPSLKAHHDLESIISSSVNTYTLGEHVGSPWGMGRMLRWTPAAPAEKLASEAERETTLRSVGLYKVQGDAVAAVMGGIFYQFGGSVAHRVFHTRLLPKILLQGSPSGLLETFHRDALSACEHMGGTHGNLLLSSSSTRAS